MGHTHRETEGPQDPGISGYLQLPTTVVQEELVAGVSGDLLEAAVGVGARGQGDLTGYAWEGHQEPALLGDIAARREDPDI